MGVVTIEADQRRCMNNENTRRGGSAAHHRGPSRSKQEKQVAELAAHQAAISEVLRAIAGSPHDLQPILRTIIATARCVSAEQRRAASVLSRMQAFVSLRIHEHADPDSPTDVHDRSSSLVAGGATP